MVYNFQCGAEYIVYAYFADAFKQSSGRFSTGICSPTRPIDSAGEDLEYFRQLANADPTGEIRVTAFDPYSSWRNSVATLGDIAGLAGAQVTIEGHDLRKTATTGRNGRHVFGGLPPGEYSVAATLDGYMMPDRPRPVRVHAKGCAGVPVKLRLDRMVTGRILTRDGLPAAGVAVEAVPTRPRHENELPFAADSATTDANGRYELRRLTPGDYYLGISLSRSPTVNNPYTRWFYPGTEDATAAAIVHVSDQPGRQSFELTLPARQNPRAIEGVVVWPNGKPATNAKVFLEDPRWPWQVFFVAASTHNAGRFTARPLDGTRYRIHAVSVSNDPSSAEPVPVEPGARPAKVALVLTRKGDTLAEHIGKGLDAWRKGLGLR